MALTSAQLATLKAAIDADAELAAIPNNPDGAFAIALLLNATAAPDYWVWRSKVTQADYVSTTSLDGTTWSWTTYIQRSQGERDGWREMFADTGAVNPSNANVRAGFADVFSGAGGATQRTHLTSMSRRKATRGEKVFATPTVGGSGQRGSSANPDTMGFEGSLTYNDVDAARNS